MNSANSGPEEVMHPETEQERYQHLREMVAALLYSGVTPVVMEGLRYRAIPEVCYSNLEAAYRAAPYRKPSEGSS